MSLLQVIAAVWLLAAIAYLAAMAFMWIRKSLSAGKDDAGGSR